jgi:prepilin-type N-terminal cleavage/methylation domain-containing protein/prepilin-type processing-associated H-X9-DG protein
MSPRRRGFTLVELLVVIGVIAALIAMLLPVLNGARRHGERVQCASNLRQLAIAFISYCNDNHGWFPSSGASRDSAMPSDWLHWRPADNLDNSAVARYLGRPLNPAILRCPADDWAAHGKALAAANIGYSMQSYVYPFSYCSNWWLSCDQAVGQSRQQVLGRNSLPKISMVKAPSTASLLGEVDERVLYASAWAPSAGTQTGIVWAQLLSIRHDAPKPREVWRPYFMPAASNPDARGNLAFADGHVDFAPRRVAQDPRVYAPQLTSLADYPWAE